jgi:plastocyanin
MLSIVAIKRALMGAAVAGGLLLNAGAAVAQVAIPAAAPVAEGDPFFVPMRNNLFEVPELTVPVGATVTWFNYDAEPHDVIERTAFLFETPLAKTGESLSLTFLTPGTFAYVCDLHAGMEATITVVG